MPTSADLAALRERATVSDADDRWVRRAREVFDGPALRPHDRTRDLRQALVAENGLENGLNREDVRRWVRRLTRGVDYLETLEIHARRENHPVLPKLLKTSEDLATIRDAMAEAVR